jgi:hypothetical protein
MHEVNFVNLSITKLHGVYMAHIALILYFDIKPKLMPNMCVATPLWGKCEDETHIPKSGNLESSGTLATSKLNKKGKNTLP